MPRVGSACLSASAQAIMMAHTIVCPSLAAGSHCHRFSSSKGKLHVAASSAVSLRAFRGKAIVFHRVHVEVIVSAMPISSAELGLDVFRTSVLDLAHGDFLMQDWALFFSQ